MAGATDNYNLAFFDFGDTLDSSVNVKKEINRFTIIDNQLFGMYSIFGNGVISGWDITSNGLSLQVNNGIGIISNLACESDFPQTIDSLPANDSFSVYAIVTGNTSTNRTVSFI